MEKIQKPSNQFMRFDDFVDSGLNYDNEIQEEWILKDIVVKTGEGEDDWIIEKKPVKVGETNINKSIHEQAKGTDLKSLIALVVRTGDESLLNQKEGSFVDISNFPNDESLIAIKRNEAIKSLINQPKKIGDKNLKDILATKESFESYINDLLKEHESKIKSEVKPEVKPEVKSEENKEGN